MNETLLNAPYSLLSSVNISFNSRFPPKPRLFRRAFFTHLGKVASGLRGKRNTKSRKFFSPPYANFCVFVCEFPLGSTHPASHVARPEGSEGWMSGCETEDWMRRKNSNVQLPRKSMKIVVGGGACRGMLNVEHMAKPWVLPLPDPLTVSLLPFMDETIVIWASLWLGSR